MHTGQTTRATVATTVVVACALGGYALAQSVTGGFNRYWGSNYAPLDESSSPTKQSRDSVLDATAVAEAARRGHPAPEDARARLVYWNQIAIDASGVDHTPVAAGETRVFGEQLGPGRASRALAIVHVAIFDAVNAITKEWQGYADVPQAPAVASIDAAIAQAAHDALVGVFPSQSPRFDVALAEDLEQIPERGKPSGVRIGAQAAAAILSLRADDGSSHVEPRVGIEFTTSNEPGR